MIGDLHCHTRISDGSMGLEDVIFYAKRGGLDFVGITDHDSLAGISRAGVLGQRYGMRVVGGVELSCVDNARGRRVHILCYLPKHPDRLEGICKRTLESRTAAGREMIKKVCAMYPVTADHINRCVAGSKSIYKAHIMQALIELGYTDRIYSQLFTTLLSEREGSCHVAHEYPDVHTVLKTVHLAGGVAVLAHPHEYDSFDLAQELAEQGVLDGIEYRHPRCPRQAADQIAQLAEHYGLIKTGGTDFHGAYSSCPNPIGTCVTTGEDLDRLFKLAKERK